MKLSFITWMEDGIGRSFFFYRGSFARMEGEGRPLNIHALLDGDILLPSIAILSEGWKKDSQTNGWIRMKG